MFLLHGTVKALIERAEARGRIRRAPGRQRVVALLGPCQCGKTTLARALVAPSSSRYFDLEDPAGPMIAKTAPSPMLYVGFLLAAQAAHLVLHYKPQG